MQFKPKTEKEIREAQLWPVNAPGSKTKIEYDFEVSKAEQAFSGPASKNPGTEYIRLTLRIFDANGKERMQPATLHPAMDAQVRHFCEACGLMDKYNTGTLTAEDCEGKTGKLKLKIKEDDYGVKNEVADYVVPKEKPATPAPAPAKADDSDDVPF